MWFNLKRISLYLLITICFICASQAQYNQSHSAAEILHQMQKLQHTARVLYIAAHPDDENTRFISYIENGRKFEAAYLALTRGDGGQNVIGPELRESLGLIRTQELLAARRTDGGEQFFSRANDFGYSKTPNETFNIWDREAVLADAVWVIRNFQPDIIVTRFNETPGITHGHHTASAVLAREAFKSAADKSKFKEQLEYVDPWQTKKLYWNTSSWFFRGDDDFDESKYIRVDVGGYDATLGESYTEIAADSRSNHKSQAFGSTGTRGEQIELFEQWEGEKSVSGLFDGVATDWSEIKGGKLIQKQIADLLTDYDPLNPSKSIEQLVSIKKLILAIPDGAIKRSKTKLIDKLIIDCLGFYHLLATDKRMASPGDSLNVYVEFVNRSALEIQVKDFSLNGAKSSLSFNNSLSNNQKINKSEAIVINDDHGYSTPYWLKSKGSVGMYQVSDQLLRGRPENEPAIFADFTLAVNGTKVQVQSPLVFRENDRIKGEVIEPFYVTPPVSLEFEKEVIIFTKPNQQRMVEVSVKALKENVSGEIKMQLPEGWQLESAIDLSFDKLDVNEKATFNLTITSGKDFGKFNLAATAYLADGQKINNEVSEITYDHIPNQVIISEANAQLVFADVKISGKQIGYIPGAGDVIPDALEAMGFQVSEIDIASASKSDLARYDAIVAGIRAYNTNEALQNNYNKLFDYMNAGGNYVVQYNTTYSLPDKDFFPYQLNLSRDRITDETAELNFLDATNELLNYPNKITQNDFKGWVQERGLYFPDAWSKEYQPIFSGQDEGESAKEGSLLVAKYGKGRFVYTGISFFRELPAGVPGAYRLFANLVSSNQEQ